MLSTTPSTHGDFRTSINKELADGFITLTDGATVNWDLLSIKLAIAKLTSTQSFTLNMTNVISGCNGTFKLITSTASAITITFDTDFTNKKLGTLGEETFTTYTFPASTGKEYLLSFIVEGTTIHWIIGDISQGLGIYQPYTITHGGYSVNPTSVSARYALGPGKMCHVVAFAGGNGTSNATTKTITLPFAAANTFVQPGSTQLYVNNGTAAGNGVVLTRVNSTTADVYTAALGAWTASGNARAFVYLNLFYETV